MKEPENDGSKHWVYRVESDANAVARANRRIQKVLFAILAGYLTLACWVWWVNPPKGQELWPPRTCHKIGL